MVTINHGQSNAQPTPQAPSLMGGCSKMHFRVHRTLFNIHSIPLSTTQLHTAVPSRAEIED